MQYESIIGLEIHVQLKTKSKMFCSCDNHGEDAPPNTLVCPICTGHPGTLPVVNQDAVRFGVLTALALNCEIPAKAKFDRKNYFYPDLPKGYQISMFDEPVGVKGFLEIHVSAKKNERTEARVNINRVHLEEDAAKLIHSGETSLVDFNRAGTPLMEIVTEPDMRSPLEAKIFLQNLRRMMRYLGVSDADMEKGNLRCDANISLRPLPAPGEPAGESLVLHQKTEVKNMNSFKAVERALEHEIMRQEKLWGEGTPPEAAETRGWNDAKGITEAQRVKEAGGDYRYFPEPDIPPLTLSALAEELRFKIPELPAAKQQRFMREYGMRQEDAALFVDEKKWADYTEQVIMELASWVQDADGIEGTAKERFELHKVKLMKLLSGWLGTKLFGLMEKHNVEFGTLKITPENFAEFLTLLYASRISSSVGLIILEEMLATGADPEHILADKKLEQVSGEEELLEIVQEIIEANPVPIADYKKGKENALQALVGKVMKTSKGKANPTTAQKMLKKMIK